MSEKKMAAISKSLVRRNHSYSNALGTVLIKHALIMYNYAPLLFQKYEYMISVDVVHSHVVYIYYI